VSLYVTNQTLLPTYTKQRYFSVNRAPTTNRPMVAPTRARAWTTAPGSSASCARAVTNDLTYVFGCAPSPAPRRHRRFDQCRVHPNVTVARNRPISTGSPCPTPRCRRTSSCASCPMWTCMCAEFVPADVDELCVCTPMRAPDEFIGDDQLGAVPRSRPVGPLTTTGCGRVNTNTSASRTIQATEYVPVTSASPTCCSWCAEPGTQHHVPTKASDLRGDYYLFDHTKRHRLALFEWAGATARSACT